jgi:hypothetical protein
MKIVITERQYKVITEQSDYMMDRRGNALANSVGIRSDKDYKEVNKILDKAHQAGMGGKIDPHTLMTVLAIGTAFIPVAGPFISAGIGLADAALYYKEGDKTSAGVTAAFSMIPFIGKIPGVKELGSKGMALLGSKLAKGVKVFSPAETTILNAVKQNEAVIKQGLESASAKLTPVVKSVESFKPKFIAKFGQQRYDELLQQFLSSKITKDGFLNNLKSASGPTYKMAKMAVQGGIKFAKSELNQMSELASIIKQGGDRTLKLNLIVNGTTREVEVFAMSFPGETFAGQAVGRNKIFMNLDNLVGKSETEIRQILNHEATHIKDPSLVSPKLNQSYDKIQKAKSAELKTFKNLSSSAEQTGKGADDAIKAGKKYQDLYQRYLYHPQEIVANNQMILNNMTSEINNLVGKVGAQGAKQELDNVIAFATGKIPLAQESLELLGERGAGHLIGLSKYNQKYYQNFLKKLVKQSEYLKSQLKLLEQ